MAISDNSKIGDQLTATIVPGVDPNEKGPDPEIWGQEHADQFGNVTRYASAGPKPKESDEYEIKGPDPAIWGEEHAAKFDE
jgi:hypothetical protein